MRDAARDAGTESGRDAQDTGGDDHQSSTPATNATPLSSVDVTHSPGVDVLSSSPTTVEGVHIEIQQELRTDITTPQSSGTEIGNTPVPQLPGVAATSSLLNNVPSQRTTSAGTATMSALVPNIAGIVQTMGPLLQDIQIVSSSIPLLQGRQSTQGTAPSTGDISFSSAHNPAQASLAGPVHPPSSAQPPVATGGPSNLPPGMPPGLAPLFQGLFGPLPQSLSPRASAQPPADQPSVPPGIVPDPNVNGAQQTARRSATPSNTSSASQTSWDMGRVGTLFASLFHMLGRRRSEGVSPHLSDVLPPLPVASPSTFAHLFNLLAPILTLKQLRRLAEGHATPFKDILPTAEAWARRDCLGGLEVTERNVDSAADRLATELLSWIDVDSRLAVADAPEALSSTLKNVLRDYMRRFLFMVLAVRPGAASEFAPAFSRDIVLLCKDLLASVRAKTLSACDGNKSLAYGIWSSLLDSAARKVFSYFRMIVEAQETAELFVGETVQAMFGSPPENFSLPLTSRATLSAILNDGDNERRSTDAAPAIPVINEELFASMLRDAMEEVGSGAPSSDELIVNALSAGLGGWSTINDRC
ncbi:hypothetical protein M427DRAFT_365141 [Gonapodya prolifera JEL478]|uniref:Uncharacterized protein n=1 Tax=Gonapodya prolifera (strain JEL478) TaxID=1344416 RepID=A0A139AAD0_GONPJ|nr:hypothetical protein M427DRAFT_365141 [Gonapodya prolifera JEL478]|eukprot:KXS13614.1 hypothetical protein M427DRAFT_365141 [Gonapodya prolifera JEL478]